MAGDWIKMTTELHEKPEVVKLVDTIKVDEFAVVGRLHRIWSWFSEHTKDGEASGVTPAFIDRLVALPGFADAMTAVGWLKARNGSLVVPTWDRHNSQSAKTRALTRDRVKRSRNDLMRTSSSLCSSLDPPSSSPSEGGPGETAPIPQADFPAFWRVAARRVGKGQAERAWAAAVKQAAPEVIVEAMTEYAAAMAELGKEAQFIRHPATWLNGKGWADDRAEWWGRDSAKREAWRRKRAAIEWWGGIDPKEQDSVRESIMAIVRMRDEWDPIRQAWERDHAAGKCERFAVEALKRKGK